MIFQRIYNTKVHAALHTYEIPIQMINFKKCFETVFLAGFISRPLNTYLYMQVFIMTYCFPLSDYVAITVNEPTFVPLSEEVHIQDVHRFRRDVDLYPVEKEFVFTFKNQQHHLRLKRNNDIEIKTPIYVVRNGNIERQSIPIKKVKITVDRFYSMF